jgi:DNA-binding response OmpR family regulator
MTARQLKILVVDDDADARLVMRAALRKAGFAVRLADCGADALRQFALEPSDMVMLDVEMPDLSGHEVCAALRPQAGPLLPIVMVTGLDDLRSVEAAYEVGATDFVAKRVNWALGATAPPCSSTPTPRCTTPSVQAVTTRSSTARR